MTFSYIYFILVVLEFPLYIFKFSTFIKELVFILLSISLLMIPNCHFFLLHTWDFICYVLVTLNIAFLSIPSTNCWNSTFNAMLVQEVNRKSIFIFPYVCHFWCFSEVFTWCCSLLPKEHEYLAFLLVQVCGLDPPLLLNCKFCSLFFFLDSVLKPLFWLSSGNTALPVALVMSDEKLAVTHFSVALYVRVLLLYGCFLKKCPNVLQQFDYDVIFLVFILVSVCLNAWFCKWMVWVKLLGGRKWSFLFKHFLISLPQSILTFCDSNYGFVRPLLLIFSSVFVPCILRWDHFTSGLC